MTIVNHDGVETNLGSAVSRTRDQAATALIDLSGAVRKYSFADLHRYSRAVARALVARGLNEGDRVAILSANRAEYLFVYFGAMQAGLVPVPVNIKLPAFTIDFILGDCDARLIFCDSERVRLSALPIPRIVFSGETQGPAILFEEFLDWGDFEPAPTNPEQPAMFLYTSGSTGIPKGVVLSHASHLWVKRCAADRSNLTGYAHWWPRHSTT